MANTFETLELNEGSGGGKVAGDTFTQSAVQKFMPASTLAVPDGAGDFNRVGDTGVALPVVEDNSADILAALSAISGLVDGLETAIAALALESGGNLASAAGGIGAANDAMATQGGTGSLSAKLRLVTSQLNDLSGFVNGVESLLGGLAVESGGNLAAAAGGIGAASDAAATQGSTGTISAKLRLLTSQINTLLGHTDGLETLLSGVALETGGNLAAAAGGIGTASDAAATQGAAGSISAKLRTVTSQLNTISGYLDGVETLLAAATPAGTNLIGLVAAGADASNRYNGSTAITPKFANIDVASSGDNQIVAAVTGKTLRVISVFLAAAGAVDVKFNDGTANLLGGTRVVKLDNTGAVGNGGFCLQENRTGWFQTAGTNRPINLNLSGAVGVAGVMTYVEV